VLAGQFLTQRQMRTLEGHRAFRVGHQGFASGRISIADGSLI